LEVFEPIFQVLSWPKACFDRTLNLEVIFEFASALENKEFVAHVANHILKSNKEG
jgi:hypothetical protein